MTDKKPTCFIIMPMSMPAHLNEAYGKESNHFTQVLECLLIPAAEKAGYKAIPPKAEGAVHIKAGIIKSLKDADIVLCDMSALNPNVFFELGVRTALNRPICLVRDSLTLSVPFDTNDINYHAYNITPGFGLVKEIDAIAAHITKSAADPKDGNALWIQYGIAVTAQLTPTGGTGTEAKLDYLIRRMNSLEAASKRQRSETSHDWRNLTAVTRITAAAIPLMMKTCFDVDCSVEGIGGNEIMCVLGGKDCTRLEVVEAFREISKKHECRLLLYEVSPDGVRKPICTIDHGGDDDCRPLVA